MEFCWSLLIGLGRGVFRNASERLLFPTDLPAWTGTRVATVEPDVASRRLRSGGKSLKIGVRKHDAHRVVPGEALFGIQGEAFRRVCRSAIGGNPGWECLDQCPYPIKRRAATLTQLFRGATPESETKAGRYDIRFGVISIQEPKIHGSKQSVKNLGPCFDRSRILADHI